MIRRLAILVVALGLAACSRKPAAPANSKPPPQSPPRFAAAPRSSREGLATWYDVPAGSLPERRAGKGELTAASDTLPMETYVRVTRLDTGKSVVARITDKGIHHRGAVVDVCKEAAAELDMVSKGETRVRVDELAPETAAKEK